MLFRNPLSLGGLFSGGVYCGTEGEGVAWNSYSPENLQKNDAEVTFTSGRFSLCHVAGEMLGTTKTSLILAGPNFDRCLQLWLVNLPLLTQPPSDTRVA